MQPIKRLQFNKLHPLGGELSELTIPTEGYQKVGWHRSAIWVPFTLTGSGNNHTNSFDFLLALFFQKFDRLTFLFQPTKTFHHYSFRLNYNQSQTNKSKNEMTDQPNGKKVL